MEHERCAEILEVSGRRMRTIFRGKKVFCDYISRCVSRFVICVLFVVCYILLCFVFCSVSDGSSFNDDLSFMHHSDFVEENWYPPICTLTEKQTIY